MLAQHRVADYGQRIFHAVVVVAYVVEIKEQELYVFHIYADGQRRIVSAEAGYAAQVLVIGVDGNGGGVPLVVVAVLKGEGRDVNGGVQGFIIAAEAVFDHAFTGIGIDQAGILVAVTVLSEEIRGIAFDDAVFLGKIADGSQAGAGGIDIIVPCAVGLGVCHAEGDNHKQYQQ